MRIRNAERKFGMQLVKDITNKTTEIPGDECCLQEQWEHRHLTKDIRLDFAQRTGLEGLLLLSPTYQKALLYRWPGTASCHVVPTYIPPIPNLTNGREALSPTAGNSLHRARCWGDACSSLFYSGHTPSKIAFQERCLQKISWKRQSYKNYRLIWKVAEMLITIIKGGLHIKTVNFQRTEGEQMFPSF